MPTEVRFTSTRHRERIGRGEGGVTVPVTSRNPLQDFWAEMGNVQNHDRETSFGQKDEFRPPCVASKIEYTSMGESKVRVMRNGAHCGAVRMIVGDGRSLYGVDRGLPKVRFCHQHTCPRWSSQ